MTSIWRWLTGGPDKPKPKPRLPEASGADYSNYKHPFENLVFKGGGAKGIAYIGACKILDEAGILPNIKRFAGTSAGAITATLLAIGMTPEEMLEELSQKNLMDLVENENAGLFNWCPHIPGVPRDLTMDLIIKAIDAYTKRGMCDGSEFDKWFGSILEKGLKTHHPDKKGLDQDITFDKLYNTLGKELCIVAYNMVFGNETYFHVKTTPVIKIREAVRMSMSIPGVFRPYEKLKGLTFIDGGLAANYPIWAFDGWYLSMRKENTFKTRLKSMLQDDDKTGKTIRRMFYWEHRTDRFDTWNKRTLGILMLSAKDREMYQDEFMKRLEDIKHVKSHEDTKLYKAFKEAKDEQRKLGDENIEFFTHLVADGVKTLIESIEDKEITKTIKFPQIPDKMTLKTERSFVSKKFDGSPQIDFLQVEHQPKIPREEAEKRFYETFTEKDLEFLGLIPKEKAFESLMLDDDDNLTTARLRGIYENAGPLQLAKRTYLGRRHVKEPRQYYGTMLEFVGNNSGITEKDIGRSVGIDVEYVGTMDFDMEPEDMEFLMRQGAAATIAFLEEKKAALET